MKRASFLFSTVVAAAALVYSATSTHAESSLTWVSAAGANSANCDTIAGACPDFLNAIGKTSDGGIIRCAGPLQFIPGFTITKSVTIDCALGGGGINAQRVAINAPGKTVILQSVDINCVGFCPAAAIDIIAAASVTLQNVNVGGVPAGSIGIYDHQTGPGYLVIEHTKVAGNGGPGIVVAPGGGNIGVVLDNVRSNNNTYGLGVGAGGRVMIKRSVFSANSVAGIKADSGAFVGINETLVSHNSTGVISLNGSSVALSNSDIDSNGTAMDGTWYRKAFTRT